MRRWRSWTAAVTAAVIGVALAGASVAGAGAAGAAVAGAGVAGAAVAGAGVAGAAPVAPDVTGGQPDGLTHPYVGTVFAPGFRSPNCTGVLVRAADGRTVLLTDAHCVSVGGARFGAEVGVDFAPSSTPAQPVMRGSFVLDPLYASGSTLHDLAAVVLPAGGPSVAATLAPLDGDGSLRAGSGVTVVGYGRPYAGQRRSATEIVTAVTPSWVLLAAGSGNTCDGDSGGPDLLPGTATVVALTDQGSCSVDEDTRVDTVEAHWFADAAAADTFIDGPLLQPSLLGLAAARDGSTVTIHVASRSLDITTGRYRAWAGSQVDIQRWTRSGWVTISVLATDGSGNLQARLHIPFRVGLRAVRGPDATVRAVDSAPLIV